MSDWRSVGLRGRLALALAAVVLLSVALATVLADSGLTSRLDQSARERLHAAAGHTAQLAASLYQQQHDQWTNQTLAEFGHLAGISGYRVAVYDPAGRLLGGLGPALAERTGTRRRPCGRPPGGQRRAHAVAGPGADGRGSPASSAPEHAAFAGQSESSEFVARRAWLSSL